MNQRTDSPTPSGGANPKPDPQEFMGEEQEDTHGGEHQDATPAVEPTPKREDLPPQSGGKKGLTYYEDPRDAIEESIDARRHASDAKDFEDWNDPNLRFGQDKWIAPHGEIPLTDPRH